MTARSTRLAREPSRTPSRTPSRELAAALVLSTSTILALASAAPTLGARDGDRVRAIRGLLDRQRDRMLVGLRKLDQVRRARQ